MPVVLAPGGLRDTVRMLAVFALRRCGRHTETNSAATLMSSLAALMHGGRAHATREPESITAKRP